MNQSPIIAVATFDLTSSPIGPRNASAPSSTSANSSQFAAPRLSPQFLTQHSTSRWPLCTVPLFGGNWFSGLPRAAEKSFTFRSRLSDTSIHPSASIQIRPAEALTKCWKPLRSSKHTAHDRTLPQMSRFPNLGTRCISVAKQMRLRRSA